MFYKIVATIVLFAFFATSEGKGHDDVWTGLTAVWDSNYTNGFHPLPESLQAAKSENWTEIENALNLPNVTALCIDGDPRFVLLYSQDSGDVLGVQMAFPETDVEPDLSIDYNNHRDIKPKTYNGVIYYTTTVWFAIIDGKRRLWIEGSSGRTEYSTDTVTLSAEKVYLKKNCQQAMGTHYYQINSTTDCSNLEPIALLTNGTNVVGISYQILAYVRTAVSPMRQWVEKQYTWDEIYNTIPDSPYCVLANGTKVGLVSTHCWMLDNPTDLTCSD